MLGNDSQIAPLLLAGGESRRMGQEKFLLSHPDGRQIYLCLSEELKKAVPTAEHVYISLHDPRQASKIVPGHQGNIYIIYDYDALNGGSNSEDLRIGPAAGILAAHKVKSSRYWLVLACDYPLITARELSRLIAEFEEPVTCYENDNGFSEPLVGIWSPSAIERLKSNVASGNSSPSRVVKELGGKTIKPLVEHSIFNCNTPGDWEEVLKVLKARLVNRSVSDGYDNR